MNKAFYASVFLLSGAALAYEILLMRLFAIIQWHHFAYMVIGLALLGYGFSGTVVSLLQQRLLKNFRPAYLAFVLLFGVTAVLGFLIAQQIPFNAEVILWDANQVFYLLMIFLLLSLPFFFAASAICLAFLKFQNSTSKIYAADLVGAAFGSLGLVVLLHWIFALQVLSVIGVLSVFAAALLLGEIDRKERTGLVILLAGLVLMFLLQPLLLPLNISPYKDLSQTLRIPGATVVDEKSSPLGQLSLVQNRQLPFRFAPGLSLNASQEPVEQLALFTDAGNMTVINRFPEFFEDLSYLDQMPSALPFHLNKPQSMLIVGGGGGTDVLQALYFDVPEIHLLELNPQIIDWLKQDFADYSGGIYLRDNVTVFESEVRDYLSSRQEKYPLIQISLMDGFNASSSGLHALHESYLYTVEAIGLYLSHVQDNGYLALTRWINLPPRDSLKLFNTVNEALRQSGVKNIGRRLIWIRGWQTSTLLVKQGEFTAEEFETVKLFNRQRSFDLAWAEGMTARESNRFNKLASPVFFEAATALLSDKHAEFVKDYKFDLTPATDDQPFFHFFFRWQTFTELFELREQGGMPLMEWGYLVLVASLMVSIVASLVLILLPLWFFKTKPSELRPRVGAFNVVMYFFLIGLAFLMMEIAFMQKFVLFLHHPVYAIALTLTAFLLFAGLGSYYSQSLALKLGRKKLLWVCGLAIAIFAGLYLWLLPWLFAELTGLGLIARMLVSLLLIAPLAFVMGMPFPLALSNLAENAQNYIPWAWGINGCASVISASLATLLAIHFGFSLVIVVALLLYLLALRFFPSRIAV